MKFNRNKIVIFSTLMIFLIILFFGLMNFILPVRTSVLSGDVGDYKNGDVLFYIESESYNVNDSILYTPSSIPSIIVAKIVEKNPDGTFKVIGANPEPIDDLDQNNLKKEQIMGKVIANITFYIFYPILFAILIILDYFLTIIISKKVNKQ